MDFKLKLAKDAGSDFSQSSTLEEGESASEAKYNNIVNTRDLHIL